MLNGEIIYNNKKYNLFKRKDGLWRPCEDKHKELLEDINRKMNEKELSLTNYEDSKCNTTVTSIYGIDEYTTCAINGPIRYIRIETDKGYIKIHIRKNIYLGEITFIFELSELMHFDKQEDTMLNRMITYSGKSILPEKYSISFDID